MQARETRTIAPEVFRRCVGEFATGAAVVCAEWQDEPAGMTLNSLTSVSLDPLLVLVSLGHGSRTLSAVRGSERFPVSVLGRDQRAAAIAFAARGDPFPRVLTGHDHAGVLIVRGAVETMGCIVSAITRAGDHDAVVGSPGHHSRRRGTAHLPPRALRRPGHRRTGPAGHPIGLDEGAGW